MSLGCPGMLVEDESNRPRGGSIASSSLSHGSTRTGSGSRRLCLIGLWCGCRASPDSSAKLGGDYYTRTPGERRRHIRFKGRGHWCGCRAGAGLLARLGGDYDTETPGERRRHVSSERACILQELLDRGWVRWGEAGTLHLRGGPSQFPAEFIQALARTVDGDGAPLQLPVRKVGPTPGSGQDQRLDTLELHDDLKLHELSWMQWAAPVWCGPAEEFVSRRPSELLEQIAAPLGAGWSRLAPIDPPLDRTPRRPADRGRPFVRGRLPESIDTGRTQGRLREFHRAELHGGDGLGDGCAQPTRLGRRFGLQVGDVGSIELGGDPVSLRQSGRRTGICSAACASEQDGEGDSRRPRGMVSTERQLAQGTSAPTDAETDQVAPHGHPLPG